jgi:hypothetical protein
MGVGPFAESPPVRPKFNTYHTSEYQEREASLYSTGPGARGPWRSKYSVFMLRYFVRGYAASGWTGAVGWLQELKCCSRVKCRAAEAPAMEPPDPPWR